MLMKWFLVAFAPPLVRSGSAPFGRNVKSNHSNFSHSRFYGANDCRSFHQRHGDTQLIGAGIDCCLYGIPHLWEAGKYCASTVCTLGKWLCNKASKMSLGARHYHVIRGDDTSDVWVAELDGAPTVQLSPGDCLLSADQAYKASFPEQISLPAQTKNLRFGITHPSEIGMHTIWDLLLYKDATVKRGCDAVELGSDGNFPLTEDVSDADVGSFPVYVRNDRGEHTAASPAMTRVVRWLIKFIPTEQIEKRRCFSNEEQPSKVFDILTSAAKQGELETAPKDLKEISETTENSAVCVFQREYPLPHFPQIIALQSLVFLRNEKGAEENGTDVVTLRKNDNAVTNVLKNLELESFGPRFTSLSSVPICTEGFELRDPPPPYESINRHYPARRSKMTKKLRKVKKQLDAKKQKLKPKKHKKQKKQHKTKLCRDSTAARRLNGVKTNP